MNEIDENQVICLAPVSPVIFFSLPALLHIHGRTGGPCIFSPQCWILGHSKYLSDSCFLSCMWRAVTSMGFIYFALKMMKGFSNTPGNGVHLISPSRSLERCRKLHWLNLNPVKTSQWRRGVQPAAAMDSAGREAFLKHGDFKKPDRMSK